MKSARRFSWVLLLLLLLPLMADAATFSYGTGVTFNTGSTEFRSAGKLDDTHVIVAYYDGAVGMAAIGTIDGTNISFGSEYQFAASVGSVDVNVLDSTHAIILYTTSTTGYAVVATISGTSISYGTPVEFNNILRSGVKNAIVAVLDSTHIVVEYITQTGSGPFVTTAYAVAATISGTTITFGSATSLQASSGVYMSAVALDSTHVALVYTVTGTVAGSVRIASVSDTTMNFGTAVQFSAGSSDPTFAKTDATHGIITYRATSDDKAYSAVATISGTSVSFGSATAVTAGTTYYPQTVGLNASGALLIYRDQTNSSYATARMLTAAGGNVSSDTAGVYLSEAVGQNSGLVALDSVSALILTNTTAFIATTDTTAPSAPSSFTATSSSTTVSLSWTNPVDSDFLSNTIRSGTGSYPTSSTGGTAVASGVTGTSTSQTGLSDGTYYYSIFARDLRGNYSTAAQATATVDTSVTTTTTSEAPHQSAGGSRGNSTKLIVQSMQKKMMTMQSHQAASADKPTVVKEVMSQDLQKRTCERVMKWFESDAAMLHRVNARLEKRFGFTCSN